MALSLGDPLATLETESRCRSCAAAVAAGVVVGVASQPLSALARLLCVPVLLVRARVRRGDATVPKRAAGSGLLGGELVTSAAAAADSAAPDPRPPSTTAASSSSSREAADSSLGEVKLPAMLPAWLAASGCSKCDWNGTTPRASSLWEGK